jgi:hypothetical protein
MLPSAVLRWLNRGCGRGWQVHRPRFARRTSLALGLLVLEDRTLPNAAGGTNLAANSVSLPLQAILDANPQPAIELIDYASALADASIPPGGQADMVDSATITAPGGNQSGVSANDTTAVFQLDPGVTTHLDALPVAASQTQDGVGGSEASPWTVSCRLPDNQALGSGVSEDRSHDFVNAAGAVLTITDRWFNANQAAGSTGAGQAGGQAWEAAIAILGHAPVVSQGALIGNQGAGGVASATSSGPGAAGSAAEDGGGMEAIANQRMMGLPFLVVRERPLRAHQDGDGPEDTTGSATREGNVAGYSHGSWARLLLSNPALAAAGLTTLWDRGAWGCLLARPASSLPGLPSHVGARVGPAAIGGRRSRHRRARKGGLLGGGDDDALRVATWVLGLALLSAIVERRAQAVALRSQGLSLREIGRRLGGLTRQGVAYLLTTDPSGQPKGVRCSGCAASITARCFRRRSVGDALCRSCLADHPGASFALRLRSLRLAAAWSLGELAAAAAVTEARIKAYEEGKAKPPERARSRLAKALGAPDLEQLGEEWEQKIEGAPALARAKALLARRTSGATSNAS